MESVKCPTCGHEQRDPQARSCENCGADLHAGSPAPTTPLPGPPPGSGAGGPPPGGTPPPPPANSVPFEDPSRPFLERFLSTVGLAFSNPMQLFSGLQSDTLGAPLLYGVIIGTVTGVSAILWNMLFGGLAFLASDMHANEFALSTGVYVLFMFLMPILVAVGLFISAGLFHLALLILGDGRRGFGVTFRAVAYGQSPNLLALIPFCGGVAGGIWSLVLIIIGGREGHGTDWWRAILAYFLPTILCCCLLFWALTSLGLIGALSN